MEQQLAGGGTPFVRTLYAKPEASLALSDQGGDAWVGISADLLNGLISRAMSLLNTGFAAPVPPRENLPWGGQILLDLCDRDAHACQRLMDARRNCSAMGFGVYTEYMVYEAGGWRQGGECAGLDYEQLRLLRRQYGLPPMNDTILPAWPWATKT